MTPIDFGWFGSSANRQKLAATWEGVLLVLGGSGSFFVTLGLLSTADASSLASAVQQLGTAVAAIVSSGWIAWGACRIIFGFGRKILIALAARFG
jgi:hypothetical protein